MSTKIYKRNKSNKKYSKLNKKKRSILKLRGGAGVLPPQLPPQLPLILALKPKTTHTTKTYFEVEITYNNKPYNFKISPKTLSVAELQYAINTGQINTNKNKYGSIDINSNKLSILNNKLELYHYGIGQGKYSRSGSDPKEFITVWEGPEAEPDAGPDFFYSYEQNLALFMKKQSIYEEQKQNILNIIIKINEDINLQSLKEILKEQYVYDDKTIIQIIVELLLDEKIISEKLNIEKKKKLIEELEKETVNFDSIVTNNKTVFIINVIEETGKENINITNNSIPIENSPMPVENSPMPVENSPMSVESRNKKKSILQQDITWLKYICDDLNAPYELKTEQSLEATQDQTPVQLLKQTNLEKFLTLLPEEKKIQKIFTCFDLDVHPKYLIIEEFTDGTNNFVILGFPSKKMKSYFKLYEQDTQTKPEFDAIYTIQRQNFILYFAQLHNFIVQEKIKNIEKQLTKETNSVKREELNNQKEKLEQEKINEKKNENNKYDDIHKCFYYDYKYIENFYNNLLIAEKEDIQDLKYELLISLKENINTSDRNTYNLSEEDIKLLNLHEFNYNLLIKENLLSPELHSKLTIYFTKKLSPEQIAFDTFTLEQLYSYETLSVDDKNVIDNYFKVKAKCKFFTRDKNTKCTNYIEYFKYIYGIDYDPIFKTKFKDLQKEFYNKTAQKSIEKPMINIEYQFLILKKDKAINQYVPALFNVRELKSKIHKGVILRIKEIIDKDLPILFGMIDNIKETDYKLNISYCSIGDIFTITSKPCLHAWQNFTKQLYTFNNIINIDELIHMFNQNIDLIDLEFIYEKKKLRFATINEKMVRKHFFSDNSITLTNVSKNTNKKTKKNTQSLIQNDKIETSSIKAFFEKKPFILCMFVEMFSIYNIIYKIKDENDKDNKDIFYFMKFQPNINFLEQNKLNFNLEKILIQSIKKINTEKHIEYLELTNIELTNIKLPNIKLLNLYLYDILECHPITIKEYEIFTRFNPLSINTIKKSSNDKLINCKFFFNTPLLTKLDLQKFNFEIPNPYSNKVTLIRNFLARKEYIREFNKFIKNYEINDNYTYKYDSKNEIKNEINKSELFIFYGKNNNNNNNKINKIYFNINNTKYNIIELLDIYSYQGSTLSRIILWVVPFGATYSRELIDKNNIVYSNYMYNFMFLNHNNHIKLLNIIQEKYCKNNYIGLINMASFLCQNSLHIHILTKSQFNHYKSNTIQFDQGLKNEKLVNIKKCINMLKTYIKYYESFNCNIIHQKLYY